MRDMYDMKLNEVWIRFRGSVPVLSDVDIAPERDYLFTIKGQRIEVVEHDMQNGTFDKKFVILLESVEDIKPV